jgi:hypothetical protein
MRKLQLAALLVVALGSARANVAYSQNFDTGSATYTVDNAYWTDQSQANGYIIQTTNSSSVFGGAFGNSITNDASGTGYFLFIGTANTIPTGSTEFFISPSFTVSPNTQYTVSFDLTNADPTNPASIQPDIGGTLLGSPVSATGYFTDGNSADQWQQFTFSWNSGLNTSTSLILHDFTTVTTGNDFGVDDISVTSTPEPGFTVIGAMAFASLVWLRRKRAL